LNINSLKNLQARSNTSLDELIGARAELKILATNYDDLSLSIPEWIGSKLDEIETEIKSQVRSERLATLQKLKSRRSALMTADEKRQSIDAEILALEATMK
jgi:hypothetical protein